ncbi:hypothetical protein BGW38_001360 [Lunasporangiospora selenospora]|uniref:Uncharacterized protein n=1 Tax=Lunasporangiospora selenospora TaxID=979761 RepID=A0A9P6KDL0_9FUNG|nr:hypothetical protein BGW38_001360 [Lunasporangiospora selenospora]
MSLLVRDASPSGSPTKSRTESHMSLPFINNLPDLWKKEVMETDTSTLRDSDKASASLVLDSNVSPPLRFQDSSSLSSSQLQSSAKNNSRGDGEVTSMSASQRFSMDDLSGGAFAMPSGHTSIAGSIHLSSVEETTPKSHNDAGSYDMNRDSTGNTLGASARTAATSATTTKAKKKKWQSPKAAKAAAEAEKMASAALLDSIAQDQAQGGTLSSIHNPDSNLFHTDDASSLRSITLSPMSGANSTTLKQHNDISSSASTQQKTLSTIGLNSVSGAGVGIVSGLASLKSSIMIPALDSSLLSPGMGKENGKSEVRKKGHGQSQSSSVAASQSNLLDFVSGPVKTDESEPSGGADIGEHEGIIWDTQHLTQYNDQFPHRHGEHHPESQQNQSKRRPYPQTGKEKQESKWGMNRSVFGAASLQLDKLLSWADHNSPVSASAAKPISPHLDFARPSTLLSFQRAQESRGSGLARDDGPKTEARRLSKLEDEYQNIAMEQREQSRIKIGLFKELQRLYDRRNVNELQQAEAVKSERFEEADSIGTKMTTERERQREAEIRLAETDGHLWVLRRKQAEMTRTIAALFGRAIEEAIEKGETLSQKRQTYEEQTSEFLEEKKRQIQAKREDLEKQKSDVALGMDFLGKDEAELVERMDEETRTEQDELDGLTEKRKAIREDIQELAQKLEQLSQQDKEMTQQIKQVERKIRGIAQQFDSRAQEVAQERRNLDRRNSDLLRKSRQMDQQEAELGQVSQTRETAIKDMQDAIDDAVHQEKQLKLQQSQFDKETRAIERVKAEGELLRERQAGWSLKAEQLKDGLKKQGDKVRLHTEELASEQQRVAELEHELESMEDRSLKIERLKGLAVQRRDFRQASQYSSELSERQVILSRRKQELERLVSQLADVQRQQELETLQAEFDRLTEVQKKEEVVLFNEIQKGIEETIGQLEAIAAEVEEAESQEVVGKDNLNTSGEKSKRLDSTKIKEKQSKPAASDKNGNDAEGSPSSFLSTEKEKGPCQDDKISKESADGVATYSTPVINCFSVHLVKQLKSELLSFREMCRIQFGREGGAVEPGDDQETVASAIEDSAEPETPNRKATELKSTGVSEKDRDEQRQALERDIEAAVAKEDYDKAGKDKSF